MPIAVRGSEILWALLLQPIGETQKYFEEGETTLSLEIPRPELVKDPSLVQLRNDNFFEKLIRAQQEDPYVTALVTRRLKTEKKLQPTHMEQSFHQRCQLTAWGVFKLLAD